MGIDSKIAQWLQAKIGHYSIEHSLRHGYFVLKLFSGSQVFDLTATVTAIINIPDDIMLEDDLEGFIKLVEPYLERSNNDMQ